MEALSRYGCHSFGAYCKVTGNIKDGFRGSESPLLFLRTINDGLSFLLSTINKRDYFHKETKELIKETS